MPPFDETWVMEGLTFVTSRGERITFPEPVLYHVRRYALPPSGGATLLSKDERVPREKVQN